MNILSVEAIFRNLALGKFNSESEVTTKALSWSIRGIKKCQKDDDEEGQKKAKALGGARKAIKLRLFD